MLRAALLAPAAARAAEFRVYDFVSIGTPVRVI
jgi:hypothetical protein